VLEIMALKSSTLHAFRMPPFHETIIVMPTKSLDVAKKASEIFLKRTDKNGLFLMVEDDGNLGPIMMYNLIYAKTSSMYFAYIAQTGFPGRYWLDNAISGIEGQHCGLLAFNDGATFGETAIFGLAKREWVNHIYSIFLFHPEYKTHFAATELSVIAFEMGKLAYNPDAVIVDTDVEAHLRPVNTEDETLYKARARKGFDGIIDPFEPESGRFRPVGEAPAAP
jgi:hypothetical protein